MAEWSNRSRGNERVSRRQPRGMLKGRQAALLNGQSAKRFACEVETMHSGRVNVGTSIPREQRSEKRERWFASTEISNCCRKCRQGLSNDTPLRLWPPLKIRFNIGNTYNYLLHYSSTTLTLIIRGYLTITANDPDIVTRRNKCVTWSSITHHHRNPTRFQPLKHSISS